MNHKSWPLIADALSDVCCGFGLPTSHISDCSFLIKTQDRGCMGPAPWFWERAACGLLGGAIWFPSLQGGLGDGRVCCLITTSKSFLAPLVYVKKRAVQLLLSGSDEALNRPQTQLLLSTPSVDWVCMCVYLVSYAKPLPSFSSPACGRQECKSKCCSGCIRHACPTSGNPMLLFRGLKKGPEM